MSRPSLRRSDQKLQLMPSCLSSSGDRPNSYTHRAHVLFFPLAQRLETQFSSTVRHEKLWCWCAK
jgi:hypothetical protein